MHDEGGVGVLLGAAGAGAPQIQERGSGGGRAAALDDNGGGEGGVVGVRGVGVLIFVEGGTAEVLGEALEERWQRGGVLVVVVLRTPGGSPAAACIVVFIIAVNDEG